MTRTNLKYLVRYRFSENHHCHFKLKICQILRNERAHDFVAEINLFHPSSYMAIFRFLPQSEVLCHFHELRTPTKVFCFRRTVLMVFEQHVILVISLRKRHPRASRDIVWPTPFNTLLLN